MPPALYTFLYHCQAANGVIYSLVLTSPSEREVAWGSGDIPLQIWILGALGKDQETWEMSLRQAGGGTLEAVGTAYTKPCVRCAHCLRYCSSRGRMELAFWDPEATIRPLPWRDEGS